MGWKLNKLSVSDAGNTGEMGGGQNVLHPIANPYLRSKPKVKLQTVQVRYCSTVFYIAQR